MELSLWHLGITSLWRQIRDPLGFAIPRDSFSEIPPCFPPLGFTMLISLWGPTYFPIGVLLYFSFLGELNVRALIKAYVYVMGYGNVQDKHTTTIC